MIIVIIEKQFIPPTSADTSWYTLTCCVLPFTPWAGLVVSDPTLTVRLRSITWHRAEGFFSADVERQLCEEPAEGEDGITVEAAAIGSLSEGGWKVAISAAGLEEARKELFKKALNELRSKMLQARLAQPGAVPGMPGVIPFGPQGRKP